VEAVNILLQLQSAQDGFFVDVIGQGQLDKNAMNLGICIQFQDQLVQFLLCRGSRKLVPEGLDANLRTAPALHPHILARRRVVPDQHGRQPWRHAVLLLHLLHGNSNFRLHTLGNRIAINDLCAQTAPPYASPRYSPQWRTLSLTCLFCGRIVPFFMTVHAF